MSQIRVTASQLITQANELQQLNSTFKSAVDELEKSEVALKTMWEGEANNTFHRVFTQDKMQMDNFYKAIEVYVQRLQTIAARYQNAEATNTEIANKRNYR